MYRREFLAASAANLLAAQISPLGYSVSRAATDDRTKAPFRVLYSNDLTNLTSCVSPFHKAREPFRAEMLEASIDELVGHNVDAHLLQPGLCNVPWWPSRVLPAAEHYAWLKDRYGLGPDSFGRYMLAGGDLVQVFIDRCRLRKQAPFISFRLNDAHAKEWADAQRGDKIAGGASQGLTRFYVEHPEYRIGTDLTKTGEKVLNFAIPEVREHKLALIGELCENYDFDGFELDFMRYSSFFQVARTTSGERAGIISEFVAKVRELLDHTARSRKRRWLSVRVPCYLTALDALGLDLPALADAGVDIVNVSASYFTTQRTELPAIRKLVPRVALYVELCHSIWNGPKLGTGYDDFPFRRTSAEQFQTTAHQAYGHGADGVSLFNFAYYREHGGPGRGEFQEPPFEIIDHLGDATWLATQPQHYFLAAGWLQSFYKTNQLPRDVLPDKPLKFTFDLVPPTGGWRDGGRLRLQLDQSHEKPEALPATKKTTAANATDDRWTALWNGRPLARTTDVSEPYPGLNRTMYAEAAQLRAWTVPADRLRAGTNELLLSLTGSEAERIMLLDLAVR